MEKSEFISVLAEKQEISKTEAERRLNAVLDCIQNFGQKRNQSIQSGDERDGFYSGRETACIFSRKQTENDCQSTHPLK